MNYVECGVCKELYHEDDVHHLSSTIKGEYVACNSCMFGDDETSGSSYVRGDY